MLGCHQIRDKINPRLKIISAFQIPRGFICNSKKKNIFKIRKNTWTSVLLRCLMNGSFSKDTTVGSNIVRTTWWGSCCYSQVHHTKGPENNSLGQCSIFGSCWKRVPPSHACSSMVCQCKTHTANTTS